MNDADEHQLYSRGKARGLKCVWFVQNHYVLPTLHNVLLMYYNVILMYYLHYTGWSHETLECLQHLTQVIRKRTHTLAVLQLLPVSCEMEAVCAQGWLVKKRFQTTAGFFRLES